MAPFGSALGMLRVPFQNRIYVTGFQLPREISPQED